jgi:hypothetical protein
MQPPENKRESKPKLKHQQRIRRTELRRQEKHKTY